MRSHVVECQNFSDKRGDLVVIQDEIPFKIKRSYIIYGKKDIPRGGHSHKKTIQALVCLEGRVSVSLFDKKLKKEVFVELSTKSDLLILFPEDWHELIFHSDAILMVLASEPFDPEDYVNEKY